MVKKFKEHFTRSDRKNRVRLKNKLTIAILAVGLSLASLGYWFVANRGNETNNSRDIESYSVSENVSYMKEDPVITESVQSSDSKEELTPEQERMIKKIEDRKAQAVKYFAENGDNFDFSYGSDPLVEISIPTVSLNNVPVVKGIGEVDSTEFVGDFNQMFNICTVTEGQVLGGSNYVLYSHADPSSTNVGGSKSIFTALLRSKGDPNIATIEKSDMLLQENDPIEFKEDDGDIQIYRISEILPLNGTDGVKDYLAAKPGEAIVTLQACLNFGETREDKRIVLIIAKLSEIRNSDNSASVKF